MNKTLIENNYIVIPNFISKERSKHLSFEFLSYCKENNLTGDSQAKNSYSKYDYSSFLELLCEKTPEISRIVEETVLPTYSYSRIYKNGSELTKHTDRDACEISITLHLDGDSTWPIWIETPSGESRCVDLNCGDAMLYLGKIAPHWRESYDGEYYTQVFLHYVRSRGDCSYAYFDKNNELSKPIIKKCLNESQQPVSKKECTSILETETKSITNKSKKSLDEYIFTLNSIIPDELCDRILSEYQDSESWTKPSVGGGHVNENVRNCYTIGISKEEIINQNFQIRKKIDEDLFLCASKALTEYTKLFPGVVAEIDTGYEILKYETGQFYVQHTDSFKTQQRALSCSFLLNDDYEGGEFAFFDREIMIRGQKGSIIMFPSNFMFPHEIMPVISGTRYSIITWYV